eukprot:gene13426-biopygen2284
MQEEKGTWFVRRPSGLLAVCGDLKKGTNVVPSAASCQASSRAVPRHLTLPTRGHAMAALRPRPRGAEGDRATSVQESDFDGFLSPTLNETDAIGAWGTY